MIEMKMMIDKLSGAPALIPGASEEDLELFVQRCQLALLAMPPSEYLELLGVCNGAAENGVFLYSTRRIPFSDCAGETNDFIEMNLNWRDLEWMKDYLVFGESDMDVYVLEMSLKIYQVRDRQAFDNVYYEFSTFNEMVSHMFGFMAVG